MADNRRNKHAGESLASPTKTAIDEVDAGWGDIDAGWDDDDDDGAAPKLAVAQPSALKAPRSKGSGSAPVTTKAPGSLTGKQRPVPRASDTAVLGQAPKSTPSVPRYASSRNTVGGTGAAGVKESANRAFEKRSSVAGPPSSRASELNGPRSTTGLSGSRPRASLSPPLKSRPSAPAPPSSRRSTPASGSTPQVTSSEPLELVASTATTAEESLPETDTVPEGPALPQTADAAVELGQRGSDWVSTLGELQKDAPSPSVEPASLKPSVADVEVSQAVQAARRGTRSRFLLGVAAAALLSVGAGFGIYSQQRPGARAEPETSPASAALPPKSSSEPLAKSGSTTPTASVVPSAEPSAVSDTSAEAADFAAAFAGTPTGDAESFSEVIVRVSPLGAQIYDGSRLLAQTAAKVQLESGVSKILMVHLKGYQSRKVLVDGSSESVNIVMKPDAKTVAEADETQARGPHPERSFIVQSQQQQAKPKAEAAPKQPAADQVEPGDILPPL